MSYARIGSLRSQEDVVVTTIKGIGYPSVALDVRYDDECLRIELDETLPISVLCVSHEGDICSDTIWAGDLSDLKQLVSARYAAFPSLALACDIIEDYLVQAALRRAA